MSTSDQPAIMLPQDHYLHPGAATEWWWHVGTLKVRDPVIGNERTLGFEINALGATEDGHNGDAANISQIMVTDVKNQRHYQATTILFPGNAAWAESDSSKPWFVKVGSDGDNGAVHMTAASNDVTAMTIRASFVDSVTSTTVSFNLQVHQEGVPLLVFGSGIKDDVNPNGTTPLTRNNYYYSLTNLQTSGTVTIGEETLAVDGRTWMDHEYGAFSFKYRWTLQDAILDNGYQLSSFSPPNAVITEDEPYDSLVTILAPDGTSQYMGSVTTPRGPLVISTEGVTYFTGFEVQIKEMADVWLSFTTSMPDQEFRGHPPVYEGVAVVTGNWGASDVQGTAWIEQSLSKTAKMGTVGGRAAAFGLVPTAEK
jgi:predicted secreted hydrolase